METEKKSRGKYGASFSAWNKFETKLKSFSSTPETEWTEYDYLGYVVSKTGMEILPVSSSEEVKGYQFFQSTNPSRHPELRLINRIIGKLHKCQYVPPKKTWNRTLIKQFLDFQIGALKGQLTTLKYFLDTKAFSKFEKSKTSMKSSVIDRSTPLPIQAVESLKHFAFPINTWGDLALLSQIEDVSLPWLELEKVSITKQLLSKVV